MSCTLNTDVICNMLLKVNLSCKGLQCKHVTWTEGIQIKERRILHSRFNMLIFFLHWSLFSSLNMPIRFLGKIFLFTWHTLFSTQWSHQWVSILHYAMQADQLMEGWKTSPQESSVLIQAVDSLLRGVMQILKFFNGWVSIWRSGCSELGCICIKTTLRNTHIGMLSLHD